MRARPSRLFDLIHRSAGTGVMCGIMDCATKVVFTECLYLYTMLKSNMPNSYPTRSDGQRRIRRAIPTNVHFAGRFQIEILCAKRSGSAVPRGPTSSAVNCSERLLMNHVTA